MFKCFYGAVQALCQMTILLLIPALLVSSVQDEAIYT